MVNGQVLTNLKQSTAAAHAAVEEKFDLPRRLRDASSYADLLTRFYRIYAPLERRLEAVSGYESVGLRFSERRKTPLLESDLLAVGANSNVISWADQLPPANSLGEALGCFYVMEGATLGGQIIRREVAARFGYGAESGCAFFSSYGQRIGEMWERFRESLVRYTTTTAREEEVTNAALETFRTFEFALAEESPR